MNAAGATGMRETRTPPRCLQTTPIQGFRQHRRPAAAAHLRPVPGCADHPLHVDDWQV